MILLDKQEQQALGRLLNLLQTGAFWPPPEVLPEIVVRGPDGQLILPVRVEGRHPSLGLAVFMAQKAEELYRKTGCRFLLAQCLKRDPDRQMYLWTGTVWQPLLLPV